MKTFGRPLPVVPPNTSTGTPYGDMNKLSDALVEVRSFVPSNPADVNAVTFAEMNALITKVNALLTRASALL